MSVTLANALADMNLQLDAIKKKMETEGVPAPSVLFLDLLVRNGYQATLVCQDQRVPIEQIDEAIVMSLTTILLDYMVRIHPKTDRNNTVAHTKLIFDDMKERLAEQIVQQFEPEPPKPKLKRVH